MAVGGAFKSSQISGSTIMSYRSARLSASDEARIFIERIEAIEELGGCLHKTIQSIEQAVDACPRGFFEAVRLAMVEVRDIPSADYETFDRVKEYYCLLLPEAPDECAAMMADVSERGRCLLAAIKASIERQLEREQSAQEILSALMLLLWACESEHLEQRYG
ncbi:hypothetical protein [Methylobacterium fujisawaense]|uniref:hypothetical protein n=1 Tax=Methylobacterium fujisawaense TaxID=107400 RepID=UPI00313C2D6F